MPRFNPSMIRDVCLKTLAVFCGVLFAVSVTIGYIYSEEISSAAKKGYAEAGVFVVSASEHTRESVKGVPDKIVLAYRKTLSGIQDEADELRTQSRGLQNDISEKVNNIRQEAVQFSKSGYEGIKAFVRETFSLERMRGRIQERQADGQEKVEGTYNNIRLGFKNVTEFPSRIDWPSFPEPPSITLPRFELPEFQFGLPSEDKILNTSQDFSAIEPAAGIEQIDEDFQPEVNESLEVEAVLVPRQFTVISSSRDGRIRSIYVENGDTFQKGDILIEYDCDDLMAEKEIARLERKLKEQKEAGSEKLFKLDLISGFDKLDFEIDSRQAEARIALYQARMENCRIRAGFDGRVTNRLANPNEYTRTDRVLLEIASREPLQAEFLLPSHWLRWVDVGAPLNITLNETEKTYGARITRLYGEVDPVSQSIQVVADLEGYEDALLPGMSGQATLDTAEIRKAGIRGYLKTAGR